MGKPYVAMIRLKDDVHFGTIPMLEGDISGTYPFYHKVRQGSILKLSANTQRQRVLFFVSGSVVFQQDETKYTFNEKGSIIPDPAKDLDIYTEADSVIFEISWDLTEADHVELAQKPPKYPILQKYSDCARYTEYFKSDRTISRTVVAHGILPRFSMGSNEAEENDRVEINNHPSIDQYFFSFPDNDVTLLIEERKIAFKGNTLLHVPLGANHGVEIGPGQKMHYLWIDFIVDEEGMRYLDTIHTPLP